MSRSLKADQVAAAFNAVPGVFIDALAFVPGGNITTTSALFVDLTGASGTFTAPASGDYVLDIQLTCFSPNVGTYTGFQVVIDAGESEEKTIGVDDASWRVPHANANEQHFWNQRALVSDLAAGSHTFKVQWKAVSGGTQYLDAGSHINVRLQMVSGSGAAGVLLSFKEKTADQTGIAQNVTTLLTELSHTITVVDNEYFVLEYLVLCASASARTDALLYRVDSGSWLPLEAESAAAAYWGSLSGSKTIQLAVGSHTVDFAIAQDGASAMTVWGAGSYQGVTWKSWTAIRQYRGGQIPWEVDGTEVLSTPRAINIDGATVDYSVADQKLNLALPKAVTAPGDSVNVVEFVPSSNVDLGPTGGTIWQDATGASGTLTVPAGGEYVFEVEGGVTYTSGSGGVILHFRLDVGGTTVAPSDENAWNTIITATGGYGLLNFKTQKVSLAAGDHTVQLQWKYRSADDGDLVRLAADQSHVNIIATPVTGSGAGGLIVDHAVKDVDQVLTANVLTALTGLSHSVTVARDEDFDLSYAVIFYSGSNHTSAVIYRVDGGTWIWTARKGTGGAYPGYLTGVETIRLTAGTHTIEVGAVHDSASSYTVYAPGDWKGATGLGSRSTIRQHRGGLVPITDGYTTVDKPIAQEFINASVTDSGGKAVITLPEAVTTVGESVELFGSTTLPASHINSPVGWTQILPWPSSFPGGSGEASEPFTVQGGGKYRVIFTCRQYVTTGNEHVRYKVVFDENEANEQTVGNDMFWYVYSFATTMQHVTLETYVTLTPGSHTAKVYGYCATADRWRHISPTNDEYNPPKLTLELYTGSGAGGVLVETSVLASDQTFNSSPAYTYIDIPTFDPITITTSEGERVLVCFTGNCGNAGSTRDVLSQLAIDGVIVSDSRTKVNVSPAWQDDLGFSFFTDPLSAGEHTFKPQVANAGSGTTTIFNGANMTVTRFRGGLVPHKNDNVLVQDKPVAVNYLGPGLQATNVGGQVNVSVQSAAEGVSVASYSMVADDTGISSATWVALNDGAQDLAVSVDTAEGEYVSVNAMLLAVSITSASTWSLGISVDGSDPEPPWAYEELETSIDSTVTLAAMIGPLSAGTHTLTVKAKRLAGSGTMTVWGSSASLKTTLQAMTFRGGYVTPENVPRLEYNSASVINCVKAPGAADRFWLVLSDGKRYYADGTQTVDMTASGLGGLDTGSEASSTWYYVYAVPSATTGVFDVVASVTAPSSGPTGYNAWKYLGAVRNDSSSNLLEWIQTEPHKFTYRNVPRDTSIAVTTQTNYDASAYCPATATSMRLLTRGDSTQGVRIWPRGSTGEPLIWSSALTGDNCAGEVPIEGTPRGFDYAIENSPATIHFIGWTDGWLASGQTQTQAQYQPDTKRIVLTYASTTQVTVSPRGGTAIRLTLQDGKQRTVSSAVGFNPSLGAADGGLDTGTEASSTWYYVYLVPKSGDDNSLAVRGSTNAPATGPTGYSNYWYVGPVYNDSSSNIVEFTQVGLDRFRYREQVQVYSNTAPPTSWTALDLSSSLPATCQVARMAVEVSYTNSASGGAETLEIRRTGDTNTSRKLLYDVQASDPTASTTETDIEVNGSQSLDHQWTRNETFSACIYYINEFTDDYAGEATQ